MTWLLAGLLCALGFGVLLVRPDSSKRLRYYQRVDASASPIVQPAKPDSLSFPIALAASAAAALGAWLLFGGALGTVAAIAAVIIGPQILMKLEPRSSRQRRQALENAAPLAADLMSACVASGASVTSAAQAAGEALGGPIEGLLRHCVAQLELGGDPDKVWGALATEPALAPIARAILRSAASGSPLADVLRSVADELSGRRKAQLEIAARSAGIKAVAPLGLCFLPAFMLIGIVPLVASLVSQVISQY